MFGYIRPIREELKVREFDNFRACYCALCHTLGRQYGITSRFILNFDFVFLTMLLWSGTEEPDYTCKRCIASPFKKKKCCRPNETLTACAGYSVILTWWKMRDSIDDNTFIKSIPARFAAIVTRRAYKKARAAFPEYDRSVESGIKELSDVELISAGTLDSAADKFAKILSAAASEIEPENRRRALEQVLYHTGRWIYIIDACDDIERDAQENNFNPVARQYMIADGCTPKNVKEELNVTLMHSRNLAGAAFELLPENVWTSTVRNIIYMGMPEVARRVIAGTWRMPKTRMPK